ncbi:MAG: 16S rRNA (cytidine(1402)-2'-O)-methyltransferase [Gemmatimonadota bacterium]|nr:16S rRNA (cytidine(1402)-2'-O)-methyltransferase [Gemmatimonadota bacterium]
MGDSPVGRLYIVSTPIGNLGDMTHRAVETLRGVAGVLAEDTRHTRHLLERYGVATPMEPYHEHNEARATPRIVERLRNGESFALVSDAGTPLLSDPGERLVRAAVGAGIKVVPIPGASAVLAALVASGLDTARFTFFGFLPRKGRERHDAVAEVVRNRYTSILYEAPSRVADTLAEIAASLERGSDREGAVARELTKQFEELRRGTVEELARYYADSPVRGEVVIVIAGAGAAELDENALRNRARALREAGASVRDVARALADESGAPRNLAYRLAQDA